MNALYVDIEFGGNKKRSIDEIIKSVIYICKCMKAAILFKILEMLLQNVESIIDKSISKRFSI